MCVQVNAIAFASYNRKKERDAARRNINYKLGMLRTERGVSSTKNSNFSSADFARSRVCVCMCV